MSTENVTEAISGVAIAETLPEIKKMTFILEANDKTLVNVSEDAAFQSDLLRKMVSDLDITDPDDPRLADALPVSNMDGLEKIMCWCEKHQNDVFIPKQSHENQRISLTKEDAEYLDVDNQQLHEMLDV